MPEVCGPIWIFTDRRWLSVSRKSNRHFPSGATLDPERLHQDFGQPQELVVALVIAHRDELVEAAVEDQGNRFDGLRPVEEVLRAVAGLAVPAVAGAADGAVDAVAERFRIALRRRKLRSCRQWAELLDDARQVAVVAEQRLLQLLDVGVQVPERNAQADRQRGGRAHGLPHARRFP